MKERDIGITFTELFNPRLLFPEVLFLFPKPINLYSINLNFNRIWPSIHLELLELVHQCLNFSSSHFELSITTFDELRCTTFDESKCTIVYPFLPSSYLVPIAWAIPALFD